MTHCSLCKSTSTRKLRDLQRDFIIKSLEWFYNEPIPDVDVQDYSLNLCESCGLEFILPEIPGSDLFYTWITHQPNYYPSFRWEWGVVKDKILSHRNDIRVIDVGCGNGDFLKYMGRHGVSDVIGIDTSDLAIRVANVRGFKAICANIYDSDFFQKNDFEGKYDYVASFHCLEHVDRPLKFVQHLKRFMKKEGVLLISTPYSPMTYEELWYDPLNHPPHHLTRWNEKSYHKLASLLDMNIRIHFPEPWNPWIRTKEAINLVLNSYRSAYSRKKLYSYMVKNPGITLKEWKRQRQREKIAGRVVGNVILVELTEK